MKTRATGNYSHFQNLEISGDIMSAGNGVQVLSAAASAEPAVKAVGDDTNVGLALISKGTGVIRATANGQDRHIMNPVAKTIVDGSATSLADIACVAGAMSGGLLHYLVRGSDGTDHQALVGMVSYAVVNKAGTLTLTITDLATTNAKAVSSGTLTLAWTFVTGTNKGTIKLTPTGSLTETTYTVEYTLYPIRGAVTIL